MINPTQLIVSYCCLLNGLYKQSVAFFKGEAQFRSHVNASELSGVLLRSGTGNMGKQNSRPYHCSYRRLVTQYDFPPWVLHSEPPAHAVAQRYYAVRPITPSSLLFQVKFR